ncbi:MAG: hypothetical protein ABEJ79_00655 [Halolamina sp.]
MPSRRRLLAALAAGLAGTAGCVSSPGTDPADGTDGSTDSTPTTAHGSPASPTPTSPESGLAVESVVARKAVTYESVMGSGGVLTDPDTQYVVATVRTTASVEPAQFAFVAGDRAWEPGLPRTAGARNYVVAGHEGGPIGRSLSSGTRAFVAFAVPSPLSAPNPRIRFESGDATRTWSLPLAARETLPRPAPRFRLDSMSVPSEVSQGDPLPVEFAATNETDLAGRFLAAVYWPTKRIADDDESRRVVRSVGAGESTSVSLSVDTEYATGEPETLSLRLAGHVDAEREVRVIDAGTPN